MSKADKRNKFLAVFEQIREDLITHFKSEKMPEDAVTWFNEVSNSMSLINLGIDDHDIESPAQRPRRKTQPRYIRC